jgi:hypothetical protein
MCQRVIPLVEYNGCYLHNDCEQYFKKLNFVRQLINDDNKFAGLVDPVLLSKYMNVVRRLINNDTKFAEIVDSVLLSKYVNVICQIKSDSESSDENSRNDSEIYFIETYARMLETKIFIMIALLAAVALHNYFA